MIFVVATIALAVGMPQAYVLSLPQPGVTAASPAMPDSASQQLRDSLTVLRHQVEALDAGMDRVLSTALWTLGIAAAFTIGALGLVGFLNARTADRERKALATELQALVASEAAKLRTDYQAALDILRAAGENSRKELLARLDTTIENSVRTLLAPLEARLTSLNNDYHWHKDDFLSDRAEYIEKTGPSVTALGHYVQLALHSIAFGPPWRVSWALDHIEKLLPQTGKLDAFTEPDLVAMLQKLSESHAIQRDRIVALLRGTPTPRP